MSTSATFVVSDSTTEDGVQTSFMPSGSENMVPCGDPMCFCARQGFAARQEKALADLGPVFVRLSIAEASVLEDCDCGASPGVAHLSTCLLSLRAERTRIAEMARAACESPGVTLLDIAKADQPWRDAELAEMWHGIDEMNRTNPLMMVPNELRNASLLPGQPRSIAPHSSDCVVLAGHEGLSCAKATANAMREFDEAIADAMEPA